MKLAAKIGSSENVRKRQAALAKAEMMPKRTKVSRELVVNERNAPAVVREVIRQGGPISRATARIFSRRRSLGYSIWRHS